MARIEAPIIRTPRATVYCEQNGRWYTSVKKMYSSLKSTKECLGVRHQKGRKVRCLSGKCVGRWYKTKSIMQGANTQSVLFSGAKWIKRTLAKIKQPCTADKSKAYLAYFDKRRSNPKMKELWHNIAVNADSYIDHIKDREYRDGKQVVKRIQCEREMPAEVQVHGVVHG